MGMFDSGRWFACRSASKVNRNQSFCRLRTNNIGWKEGERVIAEPDERQVEYRGSNFCSPSRCAIHRERQRSLLQARVAVGWKQQVRLPGSGSSPRNEER